MVKTQCHAANAVFVTNILTIQMPVFALFAVRAFTGRTVAGGAMADINVTTAGRKIILINLTHRGKQQSQPCLTGVAGNKPVLINSPKPEPVRSEGK